MALPRARRSRYQSSRLGLASIASAAVTRGAIPCHSHIRKARSVTSASPASGGWHMVPRRDEACLILARRSLFLMAGRARRSELATRRASLRSRPPTALRSPRDLSESVIALAPPSKPSDRILHAKDSPDTCRDCMIYIKCGGHDGKPQGLRADRFFLMGARRSIYCRAARRSPRWGPQ